MFIQGQQYLWAPSYLCPICSHRTDNDKSLIVTMKDQIYHTVICLLKYHICSKDYDELLKNIDQDNVPKKSIILLVRQKTPHHL